MAAGVINLQKESGGVTKITSTDGITNTELVLPESGNIASVDTAVTDGAIARYDGTTGKLQNSGVFINDGGSVGVGTSSPVFKLDITGGTGNGIRYTNGTIGSLLGISAESGQIGTSTSHNLELLVGSTPKVIIDASGNLLLTSGTGALGYGSGAGGTVTQLTSKDTAVTLNKPSGLITMNGATLAAGASVYFLLYNSLIYGLDQIVYSGYFTYIDPINYRFETDFVSTGYVVIRVTNISNINLAEAVQFSFSILKGAQA